MLVMPTSAAAPAIGPFGGFAWFDRGSALDPANAERLWEESLRMLG